MKIAALRSLAKINRNVLSNSGRRFSFKFEMTPANRLASEQAEEAKETKLAAPEEEKKPSNFRYNVYQPRTSTIERPNFMGDLGSSHKQSVKAAIEQQNLQPSSLPEYYQKHMEKSVLLNPEPDTTEEERINKGHNLTSQRFQVSKTCANATLPLKNVKLANPFPEPVKMMMSRTVSDDEKAEQMLAESRSQRYYSDWATKSQQNTRPFSTCIKRFFSSESKGKTVSTDSDKCKKFGAQKKKTGHECPKMTLKGCPPRARKKCDRLPKHLACKKQEAPYPAYSEFCHEDPDEKPSECKLCPWKPEENPNFKPKVKKYHTSSVLMVKRSGLETDLPEELNFQDASPTVEEALFQEGMQCDMRKPPCERPNIRRCPPTKDQKKKEEAKKKKKEKKALPDNLLAAVFTAEGAQPVVSLKEEKKKDPQGSCKIKKFKFPPCKPVKKEEDKVVSKCPVKKKKRKLPDCPPEKEERCDSIVNEGYQLKEEGDKNKKCPKVDLTIDKDVMNEKCPPRKKEDSKTCPGDLMKKKRRPSKKKTQGIITPVDSKIDHTRPSKTI